MTINWFPTLEYLYYYKKQVPKTYSEIYCLDYNKWYGLRQWKWDFYCNAIDKSTYFKKAA